MTFETFWKWLSREERTIRTLGRRSEFQIHAVGEDGWVRSSRGKRYDFTKKVAQQTWNRFRNLPENERLMTGRYTDPIWAACPNRICCPYIAAAIRDRLGGNGVAE